MRPGQNKRMRGRPSNNRRGPNPLTRSYESNGPDVKIRGNAHHVAEKYLQLARDAHTNGDPVAAENYLQHAEHYYRLIASAQAAQLQQQSGSSRPSGDSDSDDLDDEDDIGGLSDRFASPAERAPAPFQAQPSFPTPVQGPPQSQPFQDRAPYESERQPQSDRGYQARPERPHNRQPDRGPRDNRPFQERQESPRDSRDSRDSRPPRDKRPRDFRTFRDANPVREAVNPPEPGLAAALPSFITTAPRVNTAPEVEEPQFPSLANYSEPAQPAEAPIDSAVAAPVDNVEAAPHFPARGRRRRVRPSFGFDSPQEQRASSAPEPPSQPDEAPAGE